MQKCWMIMHINLSNSPIANKVQLFDAGFKEQKLNNPTLII
jgi:hypothetical protein